jgi:hypothetical protein
MRLLAVMTNRCTACLNGILIIIILILMLLLLLPAHPQALLPPVS